MLSSITPASAAAAPKAGSDAALRAAAEKLESAFLAEMLKSAGVGEPREAFGGGAGEEQFSSFLRQAQADEMVKAGGIGLAEALFDALKERGNDRT
jgi:Rod binding domain-containing protein